jgi:putative MFS transporter
MSVEVYLPPQPQGTLSAADEREPVLPITSLHVGVAALCAVGFGVDLMEISVGNALSAVFSAPPNALSAGKLSWLLTSVYIGAVLGAPLVGRIADRRGLQPVLAAILLWLGLTSLLAAACSSPLWFGCFRLLSGVTLGAYPPLMVAYLTAIAPQRYRGRLLFSVCGLAYLAPPLAVFLIRWLTPIRPFGIEGWRWPFVLTGLAALMVGYAFKRLPGARDSDETRGVDDTASGGGEKRFGASFSFVAALYFLHPWIMVAFPLLTGPILLRRGYSLNDTLLYVAVATFGPAVSTFATGFLVDRTSRRLSLVACCVFQSLALVTFFESTEPWLLMTSVIAFSAGVAVYTPIMTMYGAEILPMAVRASATSLAWAGNRLAAVLVPLTVLPLFSGIGSTALAWELGCVLLATIGLIVFCGPKHWVERTVGQGMVERR